MRLSEIYIKEIMLTEFWSSLEEDLEINEEQNFKKLRKQIDELIFEEKKEE